MSDRELPSVDPLALRRRATPDRTGLGVVGSGDRYTYRELDDAADAVAAWASALPDDPPAIGLLMDRRAAAVPFVFGGVRAGKRVVLLDVTLPPEAVARRLDRAGGGPIVCDADTVDLARELPHTHVASIDPSEDPTVVHFDPLAENTAGTVGTESPTDGTLGELIAFTSGTTGDPKGVRLELEQLVASAVASALRLGVDREDRWLAPIPSYHVGGLSPAVRCTIAGTTVLFQPTFDAETTIETIRAHDVTCVSLVPTQLSRLLDAGWAPPATLRFVLLGGGPIGPDLIERCEERGVPVCPTYGTTETASQVATATPDEATVHPETVGTPLPFTDVTIVDSGTPCELGEAGEIVVDGPTVTPGYLDDDRTTAAFGKYGFHTRDLGALDDDGRLRIEGRLDDRIVTGGEVVGAAAVEDAIGSLAGVEAVAVVGIDDPEWGERIAALVVISDDLTVEDVRNACRDRLAPYAVPKTVTFTAELPRTPSGTVNRSLVEKQLDSHD